MEQAKVEAGKEQAELEQAGELGEEQAGSEKAGSEKVRLGKDKDSSRNTEPLRKKIKVIQMYFLLFKFSLYSLNNENEIFRALLIILI